MCILLSPLFSTHTGGEVQFTDEPTGNLDTENEKNIVRLLRECAHEQGYAVIVITHNQEVAEQADAVLVMRDGQLVKNTGQEVGV